ncbi:MFS transporter [Bacillus gobiensis]|uniref:MFS transporter n=1 Tax=Bacillus gobiensis TaxID=1441095 RepID=UPI003D2207CD
MRATNGVWQRNKNFRNLWMGKSGSLIGDWFNQVALGQVTLNLTGSLAAMGFVLLCRSLPSVVIGPFISPIVDLYSKKAIMYMSDIVRAIIVLIFFPASILMHSDLFLYLGAFLLGLAGVLFNPAHQAALPSIVREDDLAEANAFHSGTAGVISMIGALSGGLVASFLHPVFCFFVNAGSYAWSAYCISQVKWIEDLSENKKRSAYIRSLKQGFQEAVSNKPARAIIIIGISWGFAGGGYAILIPTLGEITFGMGGIGIGILYAVDGAGMLIGALIVKKLVGSHYRKATVYYGISYLIQAIFFALLAQSTHFGLAVLLLLFMRISSGIIVPLDTYLLQIHTPSKVRGRVFSLHSSTFMGVMQLSYASLGFLFETFGIPAMGIVIGVISFLCGLTWLFQLRNFQAPVQSERDLSS